VPPLPIEPQCNKKCVPAANSNDEQEIEDMLKGVDMWLTAGQFAERYNKRNEILLELSKAENIIDNEETAE